ncbi:hypothetical protein GQ44DRAFT_642098 [Phaeosphaeriaceae sp. PMI808]|nr:hypothetical protein GQ44DRAFT_642098 [Phaeosphaeriaceae sp. PMI808]
MELYSRLPRELRNIVYIFCVAGDYDNEVIVRRGGHAKGGIVHLVREYSGQHSYQWIEDPIISFMNTQNVGPEVTMEMLEVYYWSRTFKFSHHELPLIGPFLKIDTFGFGMKPACHMRRLHIQFQPECGAQSYQFRENVYGVQRCLEVIEILGATLTGRTEIVIDLNLAEGSQSDDDCSETSSEIYQNLLTVGLAISCLEEKGMRVKMMHSRSW